MAASDHTLRVHVDLSQMWSGQAEMLETLATEYERIAGGLRQAADNVRHMSNEWDVASRTTHEHYPVAHVRWDDVKQKIEEDRRRNRRPLA